MYALLFNLIAVPCLLIVCGYGLRALAMRVVPIKWLRFWLYPGVAVHELSHAAACFPALAPIKGITLFRPDASGEVRHGEARLRVIGPILISIAPLVGGPLVLVLLNWLLGNPLLHYLEVRGDAAGSFIFIPALSRLALHDLVASFENAAFLDWRIYVMLAAVFSISLTMVPSQQDMKNSTGSIALVLAILAAAILVMDWMGVRSQTLIKSVSWALGWAHVAIMFFALTLIILLLLAGIGKAFGKSG